MENVNLKKKWILSGLSWGLFMFIAMAIAVPLVRGVRLTSGGLIKELFIWLVLGIVYGFIMHQIEKPKSN